MKISVVVPAFNEEKLLPGTLRSIRAAAAAFDALGWAWEIVVCDNNSTDRTAEVARAGGATVVFEPVNQIGRARNTGAAGASGDWLIFVDADSQPPPELFADVAVEIQRGKRVAGGSTVKLDDDHFEYAFGRASGTGSAGGGVTWPARSSFARRRRFARWGDSTRICSWPKSWT